MPLDALSAWLRREIARDRGTRVDGALRDRILAFAPGAARGVPNPTAGNPAPGPPAATSPSPAGAHGPTPETLSELRKVEAEALACTACGLAKTRTRVVFGSGTAKVPILFIGEAPGHDEDLSGLPFVGRAGQLLTKIIEAIHLRREDVYIANVLKCRPPENRQPLPHEAAACRHFLDRQIDLIRPKIICALGLSAAQAPSRRSPRWGRSGGGSTPIAGSP
jgi:uracil-DNA glycosylase family 4